MGSPSCLWITFYLGDPLYRCTQFSGDLNLLITLLPVFKFALHNASPSESSGSPVYPPVHKTDNVFIVPTSVQGSSLEAKEFYLHAKLGDRGCHPLFTDAATEEQGS